MLTPVLIDPKRPRNRLYLANVTIGKRGQIDFVTHIEPVEEALAKLPSKHLQMYAYLSGEAPLMALQKMPIGAALGWRPARRFTQIVFVPALDGLS